MGKTATRVGLVIRSGPFQGCSARDQLDLALAAAGLEFELELFFMGEGVLQLLAGGAAGAAGLPGASKGWKALPGFCSVTSWVDSRCMAGGGLSGARLLLDAVVANPGEMTRRMRECDLVLVV